MVLVHATVLGGLPVVADVWFSGPDWDGEYDAGIDAIYWRRTNGDKGVTFSEKMMDRLHLSDDYWETYVTEQANDWLGEHAPTRYNNGRVVGEYSEDYIMLNGDPATRKATTP